MSYNPEDGAGVLESNQPAPIVAWYRPGHHRRRDTCGCTAPPKSEGPQPCGYPLR